MYARTSTLQRGARLIFGVSESTETFLTVSYCSQISMHLSTNGRVRKYSNAESFTVQRSSRSPKMLSILLVIGRAGASPPSRTAAIIFLYISIYIRKYGSTFYIGIAMVSPILAYGKTEISVFSLSISTQFDFYQHQGGTHVES